MVLNDVARMVLTGSAPLSSVFQNVFHWKQVSGTSIADNDALGDFIGQFTTAFLNIDQNISTGYAWHTGEMYLWDFTNHQWNGVSSVSFTPVAGTLVGDAVAHGVAVLGKFLTQSLRRQGRTFVPGWGEAYNTNGAVQAARLAEFVLYLQDLDDILSPAGGTLQMGTFNVDPLSPYYETFSPVTGSVIGNDIMAYQRRRKPGVGL